MGPAPTARSIGASQKIRPMTDASWSTRFSARWQRVDPSGEDGVNAVRQRDGPCLVGRVPAGIVVEENALVDEAAQHLLDEERVPLRLAENLGTKPLGQFRSIEEIRDEGRRLLRGERAQRDGRNLLAVEAQPLLRIDEFRTGGGDEEERARRARDETVDHAHQLVPGPVHVLQHCHRRPAAGDGREEGGPGACQLGGDLIGGELSQQVVGDREPRGHGERLDGMRPVIGREMTGVDEALDRGAQLVGCGVGRLVERNPGELAEDLPERPVRDPVAERQAAAAQDGQLLIRLPRRGEELLDQAALPDPGRTVEDEEARAPGLRHLLEHVEHRAHLPVATHETAAQAGDAARHRLGCRPDQAPRHDRLVLPLDR